jgi:hypothetical protein
MERRHPNEIIMQDYADQVFKLVLPKGIIGHVSSWEKIVTKCELDPSNRTYIDSDYFFDPSGRKFVHFTFIENCFNIFSTGVLRLYELNNVDDPNEIYFPAKKCELFNYDFEELKSRVFSFSFCESNNIPEEYEYNLWRLYGYDGLGVAIEFSFENLALDWKDFHLSQIYYSDSKKLLKIKKVIDNHYDFKERLAAESGISKNLEMEFPFDLFKLLAFHKYSIFCLEQEYRLIYFDRPEFNLLKANYLVNKDKKVVGYVELDLCTNRNQSLQKEIPKIAISKIQLGYKYGQKDAIKLKDILSNLSGKNYHKKNIKFPFIELTKLKEIYFK